MLDDKCRDYRAAGTRLIWVVDPVRRGVTVHNEAHPVRWAAQSGVLDGADVLAGFSLQVARLFERLARA